MREDDRWPTKRERERSRSCLYISTKAISRPYIADFPLRRRKTDPTPTTCRREFARAQRQPLPQLRRHLCAETRSFPRASARDLGRGKNGKKRACVCSVRIVFKYSLNAFFKRVSHARSTSPLRVGHVQRVGGQDLGRVSLESVRDRAQDRGPLLARQTLQRARRSPSLARRLKAKAPPCAI